MEVKIGVQHAQRELTFETDDTVENVEKLVTDAVAGGSGSLLALSDNKGRRVVVPAEKIAYVQIGSEVAGRVGFRT